MLGLIIATGLVAATPASTPSAPNEAAEDIWGSEQFRFELGGIYSFYTAAVERGTDGESNKQLVVDSSFGLFGAGSYRVWGPLSVGLFTQYEIGNRRSGEFTGNFDDDDVALVGPRFGGSYWELWFGPLVRAQYKGVFAEVGWGLVGMRGDEGRDDLPGEDGNTDAFRSDPATAWLFAVGGALELSDSLPLELILRMNYRIRYYTSRGGEDLTQGTGHGTQDFVPFVGLAWRIDR